MDPILQMNYFFKRKSIKKINQASQSKDRKHNIVDLEITLNPNQIVKTKRLLPLCIIWYHHTSLLQQHQKIICDTYLLNSLEDEARS